MENINIEDFDLKAIIAEYMEKGFLDNIIDMFKHDKNLYIYIGDLITDERLRVRIGTSALVEALKIEDPENVREAVLYILPLLKNKTPMHRADAAYLLGVIGDKNAIPLLEEITEDEDTNVRLIAKEAIEEIILNPKA
jgi:HEAT repeat protein